MAVPAHKTEYFIIEKSNLQKKANTAVNKKTPERFCIRFNLSNPEHLEVVNILSNKGRNAASYIADAILFYEKSKQSNFGISFSDVVRVLEMNTTPSETHTNTELVDESLDFDDIADDLEGFKK